MTVCPHFRVWLHALIFQFLQSCFKMAQIKVSWYVLRVKNMNSSLPLETLCVHEARQSEAMYIKTHFSVQSPPQFRSQAVVCVSTPRMYPRSGYFLVQTILYIPTFDYSPYLSNPQNSTLLKAKNQIFSLLVSLEVTYQFICHFYETRLFFLMKGSTAT